MPTSNVSLYIDNVQESDSGSYSCMVIIPGKGGLTAALTLDVKGEIETPES